MSGTTNLALSDEELQLVTHTQWILTKRTVMDKAVLLLGVLSEKLQAYIQNEGIAFPGVVTNSVPKISKGENYKGLPYVILDYPRHFVKDDIFALRTLFWWGNFFSITLQLGGIYKQRYRQLLTDHLLQQKDDAVYLFTGTDPWQHHFEEDNYVLVANMEESRIREVMETGNFIKLAYRHTLEQWEQIPTLILAQSKIWLRLLED